jgi:hypothetical protein
VFPVLSCFPKLRIIRANPRQECGALLRRLRQGGLIEILDRAPFDARIRGTALDAGVLINLMESYEAAAGEYTVVKRCPAVTDLRSARSERLTPHCLGRAGPQSRP